MIKVTIVIQHGYVTQVFGNDPENTEVDVIDLDTTTEDAEKFAEHCLEKAKKNYRSFIEENSKK